GGLFLGPPRQAGRVGRPLTFVVVTLAALVLLGGIFAEPLEAAFVPAGEVVAGKTPSVVIRHRLSLRPQTIMAVTVYVLGALFLTLQPLWDPPVGAAGRPRHEPAPRPRGRMPRAWRG